MGSGLDPLKLADTIRQIAMSDPSFPTLICHDPQRDNAWVQLAIKAVVARDDDTTQIEGWVLTAGYPLKTDPDSQFAATRIELPEHATLAEWKALIYVIFALPGNTTANEIARLIIQVMVDLQKVDAPETVELALEYS